VASTRGRQQDDRAPLPHDRRSGNHRSPQVARPAPPPAGDRHDRHPRHPRPGGSVPAVRQRGRAGPRSGKQKGSPASDCYLPT